MVGESNYNSRAACNLGLMDESHSREVSAVVTAEPPETTRDGVLVLMANKQAVGRFKTLVQSGTRPAHWGVTSKGLRPSGQQNWHGTQFPQS